MSMTNVIKEYSNIISMINIDDFKDELDALDKLNWDDDRMKKIRFNPDKLIKISDLEDTKRCSLGDIQIGVSNRDVYNVQFYVEIVNSIINKLRKITGKVVNPTGVFRYPPGSICNWHTNSNLPGKRVYFVWVEDSDKSFFRYFDNTTSNVVTNYDKKGWHLNDFDVSDDDAQLFWHCVCSENTFRKSLGFAISEV